MLVMCASQEEKDRQLQLSVSRIAAPWLGSCREWIESNLLLKTAAAQVLGLARHSCCCSVTITLSVALSLSLAMKLILKLILSLSLTLKV